MRLARVRRVHERHEHGAELLEIDRLGDVAVETRVDALLVDIAEDVGGERDYRLVLLAGALLPAPDFLAGLVAVFVGHVQVALWVGRLLICSRGDWVLGVGMMGRRSRSWLVEYRMRPHRVSADGVWTKVEDVLYKDTHPVASGAFLDQFFCPLTFYLYRSLHPRKYDSSN